MHKASSIKLYDNRTKALFISLALSILIILTSIIPAKSETVIESLIGGAVSTIANEMVEGLGNIVSTGVEDTGKKVIDGLVTNFGPNMAVFYAVLSGDNLKDGLSSSTEGVQTANKLRYIGQVFGFAVAIILLLFGFILFFWSEPGAIKDTPVRLLLRFGLAIFLIWNAKEFMDVFMDIAENIWTNYIMTTVVNGTPTKIEFKNFLPGTYDLKAGVVDILAIHFSRLMLPLLVWVPVIMVIVAWPLIKGFFRLYIEIIERYLVVVLLYFFFGAAAATLVSKQSSSVFKSYMRMFACQILILFMNALFMTVFIHVLAGGGWTCSIPNYIFALAYLRLTQRVDSYMAMLGLNVAQTGGQALETLGGVARSMLGGLRMANQARQGGAKIASSAELNKGNFKTAAAFGALSGAGGAANFIAKGGATKAGLDMAAQAGQKMHTNTKEAASTIQDMFNNPTNAQMTGRVGALDRASQIEGLNKILEDNGHRMKVTDIDESRLKSGQIGFTAKPIDKDGNIIDSAPDIKGNFAPKEIPKMDNLKMDKTSSNMYMSTSNAMQGQTDQKKVKGDAQTIGYMSGASNLIGKQDKKFQDKIAGMSYDPKSDSINLFDKKDQQIGTISTVDGQRRLSQAATEPNTDRAGSFSQIIENKDNKAAIERDNDFKTGSLKWDSIEEVGKAKGHAIKEDDYGNEKQVDVRTRDIGSIGAKGTGNKTISSLSDIPGDNGKPISNAQYRMAVQTKYPDAMNTAASNVERNGSTGRPAETGGNGGGNRPEGAPSSPVINGNGANQPIQSSSNGLNMPETNKQNTFNGPNTQTPKSSTQNGNIPNGGNFDTNKTGKDSINKDTLSSVVEQRMGSSGRRVSDSLSRNNGNNGREHSTRNSSNSRAKDDSNSGVLETNSRGSRRETINQLAADPSSRNENNMGRNGYNSGSGFDQPGNNLDAAMAQMRSERTQDRPVLERPTQEHPTYERATQDRSEYPDQETQSYRQSQRWASMEGKTSGEVDREVDDLMNAQRMREEGIYKKKKRNDDEDV